MVKLRSAASVGVLLVVVSAAAACSSEEATNDGPDVGAAAVESASPRIRFSGVYYASSYDGTYALIDFVDDTHYVGWRICQSIAEGDPALEGCIEKGTYVQTRDRLV